MHKGSLLCRYKIICGEFRLSLPSATAINSESLTVFAEKKPGLPVAPRFVRIFSSSCLYKKRPGLSLICKNSLDEYSKKCCLLLLRRRVNLLVSNLCCRRRVHAINRISFSSTLKCWNCCYACSILGIQCTAVSCRTVRSSLA